MTRLDTITRQMRRDGQKALVPFLTAGYPDRRVFEKLVEGVAKSGCRLMEIGVPFSDPVADGPVIQASSQQALKEGITLEESLSLAGRAHQEHGLEVILMGYLNPILHLGSDVFAAACHREKVAGVIVPDLPAEEAAGLRSLLAENDVTLIDLVAPTTTDERLQTIGATAAGFLYLVSVTGVTGSGLSAGTNLSAYLERVASKTDTPGYVGFGVASAAQAAEICRHADGVIIGSELIRRVEVAPDGDRAASDLENFLTEVNRALAQV